MEEKHCLNCGTPLTDAFCPHCGQKASVRRLNTKTAIIDNTWSAFRMDAKVLSTAWLLITRPWEVIKGYIYGKRVVYTQPVRFIVIMCFLNVLVQMFLPQSESQLAAEGSSVADGFLLHIWHSIQAFLRDSELSQDIIDSIMYAPVVYLLYTPWGSRRFNLAEYSTAYLYLCGAGLAIDLLLLPLDLYNEYISSLINFVWWIYLISKLIDKSFHITPRWKCVLMMLANFLLLVFIAMFNDYVFYGNKF